MLRFVFSSTLVLVLAASLSAAPARAAEDLGQKLAPVGDSIKKGAEDTGAAIEKAAKDVGSSIQEHTEPVIDSTKQAAQETGPKIEQGAKDTGSFIGNIFHKVGDFFAGK